MFEVKFKLDPASRSFLRRFPEEARIGLREGIRKAMLLVERKAKQSFGKPGYLNVISGRLRSSISTETKLLGNKIIGEVGSNVVYSRIHEFGGHAGPGRKIYLKPTPYLGPAIENNIEWMFNTIFDSIRRSVEK